LQCTCVLNIYSFNCYLFLCMFLTRSLFAWAFKLFNKWACARTLAWITLNFFSLNHVTMFGHYKLQAQVLKHVCNHDMINMPCMTIKHAWNAWDRWFHTWNNFVDMIFVRRVMFATQMHGGNQMRCVNDELGLGFKGLGFNLNCESHIRWVVHTRNLKTFDEGPSYEEKPNQLFSFY
jgi:hypothetical protein